MEILEDEPKTKRKWYDQYEVPAPKKTSKVKELLTSSDFWNVVGIVGTILGIVLFIALR
jgi:hypothetical protein